MGYYQAGGLFSSLKKFGKWAGGAVKQVASVAAKAAPIVTAFNPVLGVGISSFGALGGRVGSLLSPQAAPAGVPMEGTPPLAPVQSALSFNSFPPTNYTPGMRRQAVRRRVVRRRAPPRRRRGWVMA